MSGAFHTGTYGNVFKELGKSEEEIWARTKQIADEIFFGEDKIYFFEGDMGYVVDTGNNDVRSEGMSYAMMVFVQLDMKEHFDRIWKWAMTYMYMSEGWNRGFFRWSMHTDGSVNSDGPAPDGEEFFAMALIFASARWGDGEGIFNYSEQARNLLHECIHKGVNLSPDSPDYGATPMWNPQNKLIKFVTNLEMTDPSYHLPHFYELFALKCNEADRDFWKEAAKASREYLKTTVNPITGLSPEYSYYDGAPYPERNILINPPGSHPGHDTFYSDAYRTIANIALDWVWFSADDWHRDVADAIQKFFGELPAEHQDLVYKVDGTVIEFPSLHPLGLLATNAQASLAARGKYRLMFAERLWNTQPRKGVRRYYDNFLYLFAFLALGGNYKIYI